jgi:K+-transporting ATPase ATPase C chain
MKMIKIDNSNSNGKLATNNKDTRSIGMYLFYNLQIALRILVVMVIVLGIIYPVILAELGQITLPFQSGGSILELDGKIIGSKLIAQEFESPKFFHTRPSSDSASTVDPHITQDNAYSQIQNISKATGIHPNTLKTIVNLNIEQNKVTNALFFAPEYVNVLEINIALTQQYPEVYGQQIDNNMDLNQNQVERGEINIG